MGTIQAKDVKPGMIVVTRRRPNRHRVIRVQRYGPQFLDITLRNITSGQISHYYKRPEGIVNVERL